MDADALLFEAMRENEKITSLGDKIVFNSEREFKGYSEEEKSRQEEISELNSRSEELKRLLKMNGNIKNYRLRHLNAKRSEKRQKIRKELDFIELRLDEISKERE